MVKDVVTREKRTKIKLIKLKHSHKVFSANWKSLT